MPGYSTRFSQVLARELSEAEGVKTAAMSILFALATLNGLVLALRLPAALLRPGVHRAQLYSLTVFGAVGALAELLMWLSIRRRTRLGLGVPAWRGWALTALECLMPTSALLGISLLASTPNPLGAPGVLVYAVVLIATSLSLDPKRSLFAGVIAAGSYLGLAFWFTDHEQVVRPQAELAVHVSRTCIILLTAGAAALLTQQLRQRIEHSVRAVEDRNRVVDIFGRYLSDEVVEVLLHKPDGLELGGRLRTVSILLADLRGFSSLSDRLPPDRVVRLINHYLGAMTEVIYAHGGTIDEFIGDAILVIFGAPLSQPDHAARAVRCALAMQLAMTQVNTWNRAQALPAIEMGIGVHSGDVVVGNIGSDKRQKYGVVGSAVNLTARIESHTVGGQVLVSADTAALSGPQLRVQQELSVHPKGAAQPIRILDVRGYAELQLPEVELGLQAIAPLPVCLRLLEGKTLAARTFAGQLLALSESGAQVRCAEPLRPWQNLAMELGGGLAFAKVIRAGEPNTFRFTDCDELARSARAQALAERAPAAAGAAGLPQTE